MSAQPAVSLPLENAAARRGSPRSARRSDRPSASSFPATTRPRAFPRSSSGCETMAPLGLGVPLRRRRQPRRHLRDAARRGPHATVDARRAARHEPRPRRRAAHRLRARARRRSCAPSTATAPIRPSGCPSWSRLIEQGADIATASPWHPDSVARPGRPDPLGAEPHGVAALQAAHRPGRAHVHLPVPRVPPRRARADALPRERVRRGRGDHAARDAERLSRPRGADASSARAASASRS